MKAHSTEIAGRDRREIIAMTLDEHEQVRYCLGCRLPDCKPDSVSCQFHPKYRPWPELGARTIQ